MLGSKCRVPGRGFTCLLLRRMSQLHSFWHMYPGVLLDMQHTSQNHASVHTLSPYIYILTQKSKPDTREHLLLANSALDIVASPGIKRSNREVLQMNMDLLLLFEDRQSCSLQQQDLDHQQC